MRYRKLVRVVVNRYGKFWEAWTVSDKVIPVKVQDTPQIVKLLKEGKLTEAIKAVVTGKAFRTIYVPLSLVHTEVDKNAPWRGDWQVDYDSMKFTIEPFEGEHNG